jgi:hypothetical protein
MNEMTLTEEQQEQIRRYDSWLNARPAGTSQGEWDNQRKAWLAAQPEVDEETACVIEERRKREAEKRLTPDQWEQVRRHDAWTAVPHGDEPHLDDETVCYLQGREHAAWCDAQPRLNLEKLPAYPAVGAGPTEGQNRIVAEFDTEQGLARLLSSWQYENFGCLGRVEHYTLVVKNPRDGHWYRHVAGSESEYALREILSGLIDRQQQRRMRG